MATTPYDEFGRDYTSLATPDLPSPLVAQLETNKDGLNFVLPPGEPGAYQTALQNNPSGMFSTWAWHPGLTFYSTTKPYPPLSISLTISGLGGSFIANLQVPWNNENSWNTLQVFQRASLGGIDLDWMVLGCNALLLPFPNGVMPYQNVLLGNVDFFFAVGFKLMTPRGASQFFYPGAKTLSIQNIGVENPNAPSPIPFIGWTAIQPGGEPNLSMSGFYENKPNVPIIPVTSDNLSPAVQLPVFGGSQSIMMAGSSLSVSSPYQAYGYFYQAPSLVYNVQQDNFSISYDTYNFGGPILSATMTIEQEKNVQYGGTIYPSAILGQGSGNTLDIPREWAIALSTETAISFTLDSLTYSLSPDFSSQGQVYYLLDAIVNYTALVGSSGPYMYVWGGIPGGCGVIPPSSIKGGINGGSWTVLPGSSADSISGVMPSYIPGTYVYPIMQVPVGPDTFLVTY